MPRATLIRLSMLALSGLALAACVGMTSPEQAARICEERARAATGPTGEIKVGVTNKGKVAGGLELGVTSDYLLGKDPYRIYDDCVRRKSGQGPIRPLILEDT